jgi:hypothetical protein
MRTVPLENSAPIEDGSEPFADISLGDGIVCFDPAVFRKLEVNLSFAFVDKDHLVAIGLGGSLDKPAIELAQLLEKHDLRRGRRAGGIRAGLRRLRRTASSHHGG